MSAALPVESDVTPPSVRNQTYNMDPARVPGAASSSPTKRPTQGDMVPTRNHRGRIVALAFMSAALLATTACSSDDKPTSSSNGSGSSSSDGGSTLGSPNKATGTPIKIGFAYDGPSATGDATDTFTGAKAAAQYANDLLRGIHGHPVDL